MFRPGNLAANSPPKISNSPLKRFHVVRLLLSEVQTRTLLLMHVSNGVRVLIFGAAVLLGFSAFAPEALAQG